MALYPNWQRKQLEELYSVGSNPTKANMLKKITFVILLFSILIFSVFSGELSEYARQMRNECEICYEIYVAGPAREEWPGDYNMQVYEINRQVESLAQIMVLIMDQEVDSEILFPAILIYHLE